jgi:hypothetical protein
MSILLLPTGTNHAVLQDLNVEDAKAMIDLRSRQIVQDPSRRIRHFHQVAENFQQFDLGDTSHLVDGEEGVAEDLSSSNFPGVRGRRAVYFDVNTGTLLVGTLIVYNDRHATSGFADPGIVQTVQSLERDADEDVPTLRDVLDTGDIEDACEGHILTIRIDHAPALESPEQLAAYLLRQIASATESC